MRRAQIQHAFTFIIVTIVIIVTVILSIWLIGKLFGQSCETEIIKFEQAIKKIETQYDTVGTRLPITLPAACGAEYFCAFSQSTTADDLTSVSAPPVIVSQLKTATTLNAPKPNIFLAKEGTFSSQITTTKLIADPFCIPAQGVKFTFRIEGHGRTITLQP